MTKSKQQPSEVSSAGRPVAMAGPAAECDVVKRDRRNERDDLGDRMKHLEMIEAGRLAIPGLPTLARLDGRAFHTWTRGCERPYDVRVMDCMRETMLSLVEEFHAVLGYTQSDEITLAWREPVLFGGRFQKLTSVLAGYASSVFVREADRRFPEKARMVPAFDCRVWQVPTLADVVDVFAWREYDAVKNSVQMACQSVYSHKQLYGQGRADQMELLHARGINWNDYPVHFKRGAYAKRRTVERTLTPEERAAIPEPHRPAADAVFTRGVVEVLDLPPMRQVRDPLTLLVAPCDPSPSHPASSPLVGEGRPGAEAGGNQKVNPPSRSGSARP